MMCSLWEGIKIQFLAEEKWLILGCLEVLAWASTFFLLFARYRLKSKFWFKLAVVLFSITGVFPQVTMGIINFIVNRELDLFTLVIVVLLLYGFTIGKKHIKRLDSWAQKRFSPKEGL